MALPTQEQIDTAIPVDGTPSRSLTNAAVKAIVSEVRNKVSGTDPRLSDPRPSSGAAGGVLAGSYPNPSFAVDMATQAELNAGLAGKLDAAMRGAANGVASLDASGKVPLNQLNVSGLQFKGAWNPNTNTPPIVDGTGNTGDFYKASEAGSFNAGNGSHTYAVGDWVIFAGGIWTRLGSADTVATVNGRLGDVVLTAADVGALPDTYTPPAATWDSISGKPDLPNLYQKKIRGNIGPAIPAALVYRTSDQTLTTASVTSVVFQAASYDPFSLWSGSGITIPSWARYARVSGSLQFASNSSGFRTLTFRVNGEYVDGGGFIRNNNPGTGAFVMRGNTGIFPVQPGAVISMSAFHSSGENLAIEAVGKNIWMQVELYE